MLKSLLSFVHVSKLDLKEVCSIDWHEFTSLKKKFKYSLYVADCNIMGKK